MNFKIELMEGGVMPKKEFVHSAGFDLTVPEDVYVKRGRQVVGLKFRLALPVGYVGKICSRSGVAAKGVPGFLSKHNDEFVNVQVLESVVSRSMLDEIENSEDFLVEAKQQVQAAEGVTDADIWKVRYRKKIMEPIRMDLCSVELGHVDCGYRGEVGVILDNRDVDFWIKKGTSIAQLIIETVPSVTLIENPVGESEDGRGKQGFNS